MKACETDQSDSDDDTDTEIDTCENDSIVSDHSAYC